MRGPTSPRRRDTKIRSPPNYSRTRDKPKQRSPPPSYRSRDDYRQRSPPRSRDAYKRSPQRLREDFKPKSPMRQQDDYRSKSPKMSQSWRENDQNKPSPNDPRIRDDKKIKSTQKKPDDGRSHHSQYHPPDASANSLLTNNMGMMMMLQMFQSQMTGSLSSKGMDLTGTQQILEKRHSQASPPISDAIYSGIPTKKVKEEKDVLSSISNSPQPKEETEIGARSKEFKQKIEEARQLLKFENRLVDYFETVRKKKVKIESNEHLRQSAPDPRALRVFSIKNFNEENTIIQEKLDSMEDIFKDLQKRVQESDKLIETQKIQIKAINQYLMDIDYIVP
eukprot:TRINITY_DN5287_c0_g3_i1.p1 TRINITY_DN5287_c0_g3~~TRINITY_DN5287_c0_g3_i1.p1  ORF type:complete len:335 (-),score=59.71 TRINITY_DN5287_c0_g3_i1:73-1077(-)